MHANTEDDEKIETWHLKPSIENINKSKQINMLNIFNKTFYVF